MCGGSGRGRALRVAGIARGDDTVAAGGGAPHDPAGLALWTPVGWCWGSGAPGFRSVSGSSGSPTCSQRRPTGRDDGAGRIFGSKYVTLWAGVATRGTLVSLVLQVAWVDAVGRPAPLEGGHPAEATGLACGPPLACPVSVSVQHRACTVVHVALDVGHFCFLVEKMGRRGRPWLRFLHGRLV